MRRTIIFSLLAGLGAMQLTADEGRIPIFQPLLITQPGHYIVTRDIVTAGDVITVQASGVTIDLNGHLLRTTSSSATLITIGDGRTDVTIRNGRLSGGFGGVFYSSATAATRMRVERLEIDGVARAINIRGAESVEVLACRVTNSGSSFDAIAVEGLPGSPHSGRIVGNIVENVGGTGLNLGNLRGGEVRGNQVTNFGTGTDFASGIQIGTDLIVPQGGNSVLENVVRRSDDDFGIAIFAGSNNLVSNNVASGLGRTGIVVTTSGNRIVGNVAGGDRTGISAAGSGAGHNILERNHVEGCLFNGIEVEGAANLADSNVSVGNGQSGLLFISGTGNAYRGNMLRDNVSGSVVGAVTDAGGNIL